MRGNASLMRAQLSVLKHRLAHLPAEALMAMAIAIALVCWALRVATSGALESLGADDLRSALSIICTITAVFASASAFTYSMAFPAELACFAHRITSRSLLLGRCVVAGVIGAATGGLCAVLLGFGFGLGLTDWLRILVIPNLVGLAIGLGVATGLEMAVRRLIRSRSVLPVSRTATSVAMLAMLFVLVLRRDDHLWFALVGILIIVPLIVVGAAPLRPEWLPRGMRSLRGSPTAPLASHPFWSPVVMLWREALSTPAALISVVVIALIGTVLRFPAGAQLTEIYIAIWPLVVVVPVCSLAMVASAKATPVGPGLYGHRLSPVRVAVSAAASALVSAGFVVVVGVVLTSLTTGLAMATSDGLRLVAAAGSVVATALVFAALRKVRPDVSDLPVIPSLGIGLVAALQVSWLNSQSLLIVGAIALSSVTLATMALSRGLRSREPFTS